MVSKAAQVLVIPAQACPRESGGRGSSESGGGKRFLTAKLVIHRMLKSLDSRLRGNDE